MFALPLALLVAATPAAVPTVPAADHAAPYALELSPVRDLTLTGLALGLWATSEFLKPQLHPTSCRWCDVGPNGEDRLNGLDRFGFDHLAWTQVKTAARASDVLAYGAIPLGAIGAATAFSLGADRPGNIAEDALIVAQATAFSALANQSVKFLIGRPRPYVRRATLYDDPAFEHSDDDRMSFYSGHANLAFALVTSLGTVAELRGYEGRAYVWAVGLPLATAVAVLRVGADKHYLSDVLVGALMGSAFGVAIPLLMHPRKQDPEALPLGAMQMSMSPTGVSFSGVF